MRDGRAGYQKHGSAGKQIQGKTNSVTWAHRSPLRTKEMARDEPPLNDNEINLSRTEDYVIAICRCCQAAGQLSGT
jgi:hypothetical protein